MLEHTIAFRVYYSDTDAGGVVYYARYGEYFERGRTELLHAQGISAKTLMETEALLLPVVRLEVDYLQSAYYDDWLTLKTQLHSAGPVRLRYTYALMRGEEALARGETINVAVDAKTMRPRRLPLSLKNIM